MAKWSTEAFEELNGLLPLVPLRPDQSNSDDLNFNLIKNGNIMMGSSEASLHIIKETFPCEICGFSCSQAQGLALVKNGNIIIWVIVD